MCVSLCSIFFVSLKFVQTPSANNFTHKQQDHFSTLILISVTSNNNTIVPWFFTQSIHQPAYLTMQAPVMEETGGQSRVHIKRECPDIDGLTIPMAHVDSLSLDVDCPRNTLGHKLEKAVGRFCEGVRARIGRKSPASRCSTRASSPISETDSEKTLVPPTVRIIDSCPQRRPTRSRQPLSEREQLLARAKLISTMPV